MTETPYRPHSGRPHVIVIGSGFGGLFAAKKLQGAEADVTLIDRTSHHLFQPLLYWVATDVLSSGEIAPSARTIFDGVQNVRVVENDVTDIDVKKQVVTSELGHRTSKWEYNHLLVAASAGRSYFSNDHLTEPALGMKNVDGALEIRACIIGAFRRTELTDDPAERGRLLTSAVVDAGPTGVEPAGQLAELADRTLASSYHSYSPHAVRVVLLDGAPQVLPPFGEHLGRKAQKPLERIGIIVKLSAMMTDVNEEGVTYKDMKDGAEGFIPSLYKIWSVDMSTSPLSRITAEQTGIETDHVGRVVVNEDMIAGDYKNAYVVSDTSNRENLLGVAQVAIQGSEYVAENIATETDGRDVVEHQLFECFGKGSMAAVSHFSAVAKMGKVEVTGFIGWVLWLAVHLMLLVGFHNRFVSCVSWGLNALDRNRRQMVSTRQQICARNAIGRLAEFNKDKVEQDLPLEVRDTRHERRTNKNK